MNILVTVGMSGWPFDRLIRAVEPLCAAHDVFVQCGVSRVWLPCLVSSFVPYPELIERIRVADVVITHAGNTVRLVQRMGKVPIAVARSESLGEMANDHQVEFLRQEEAVGRVVAVWDMRRLVEAVLSHADVEPRLLSRPLPCRALGSRVRAVLDQEWESLQPNPFKDHPYRRYAYAWEELARLRGRHLDFGCASGGFLRTLAETTKLVCYGCDPHRGYLQQAASDRLVLDFVPINGPTPYPDDFFDSVSLLDVLEHCPDEDRLLAEIARVLRPNGVLVLSVPRRHIFSWLDPDNIKFRFPRLHRFLYSLRFGRDVYHARFVDLSDDLMGDMSVGKHDHTNYQQDWLISRLRVHGFAVSRQSGANMFWRFFHIPALLAGARLRRLCDRAIWLDGEIFASANLFLTARVKK